MDQRNGERMIVVKAFIMFILCIVFPICLFFWLLAMIWMLTPFAPFTRICHDFLDWHKPNEAYKYSPSGTRSKCKICNCNIVSDGEGGWVRINYMEGMRRHE